jgi:hypothetical protein
MESEKMDSATILDGYDVEFASRKKYWIAGIPTDDDLRALRIHVAKNLRVNPDDVAAAVANRRETAGAQ